MIVELVISRLRSGRSLDDCLDLARGMLDFLKAQPGFVSHELCVAENAWAQRVVWRSLDHANSANQALSETEMP